MSNKKKVVVAFSGGLDTSYTRMGTKYMQPAPILAVSALNS